MRRSWLRDRSPRPLAVGRRAFLGHTVAGLGALMAPKLVGCGRQQNERPPFGVGGGLDGGPPRPGSGRLEGGLDVLPDSAGAPPVKRSTFAELGPLGPPDENGVRLPEGFRCRIVAHYGQCPVAASPYRWHGAPDGGATFPTPEGGWIYVSNSEANPGGVGALRFEADGTLVDAYRILDGTRINCAGGATPWGTWLSCEEVQDGLVFECDPSGLNLAIPRPALGRFRHEAAAFDPVNHHVYLSEDQPDGRFYRFVPQQLTREGFADLVAGRLEVAAVAEDGSVTWLAVPDPAGVDVPTRLQVPGSTVFEGGEGLFHHQGVVYLATKYDHRVWAYDVEGATVRVLYEPPAFPADAGLSTPLLRGPDNIVVSCCGDVLVAEDGGDMQIVVILPDGTLKPLLQVEGHFLSEITGPAFDPSGDRLYFSSQRADGTTLVDGGITYEVTGPFLTLA